MSHTIYAANGKSVTFTGACEDEIIPSINRLFVYKAKGGLHVRIAYKASFRNPREIDIRQSFLLKGKSSPQGTVTPHSKWVGPLEVANSPNVTIISPNFSVW